VIRNKFHIEDHEILLRIRRHRTDLSSHGDLVPRIYAPKVYSTEMLTDFQLFEDTYAPQDYPSTTYLALFVSLPTQKFFRLLR